MRQMNAFGWALVAACIWGIVPLIEKVGLGNGNPVVAVFARTIGVMVGMAVVGWWVAPWKALSSLSVRSFGLLALGGFLASFIGQMAFYQALKSGRISQVTPLAGTYPLVAALLGWWILREPFTIMRLSGVVFIVFGIVLLRR